MYPICVGQSYFITLLQVYFNKWREVPALEIWNLQLDRDRMPWSGVCVTFLDHHTSISKVWFMDPGKPWNHFIRIQEVEITLTRTVRCNVPFLKCFGICINAKKAMLVKRAKTLLWIKIVAVNGTTSDCPTRALSVIKKQINKQKWRKKPVPLKHILVKPENLLELQPLCIICCAITQMYAKAVLPNTQVWQLFCRKPLLEQWPKIVRALSWYMWSGKEQLINFSYPNWETKWVSNFKIKGRKCLLTLVKFEPWAKIKNLKNLRPLP